MRDQSMECEIIKS